MDTLVLFGLRKSDSKEKKNWKESSFNCLVDGKLEEKENWRKIKENKDNKFPSPSYSLTWRKYYLVLL